MITPQAGWQVDPNNPNGVIPIPGYVPGQPPSKSAPTGQTAVTNPPATPTAVVSSAPAQTQVGNIKDKITNVQNETTAQMQERVKNQGKPGYDVFGVPTAIQPAPLTGPLPKEQTPEEKLLSQPSDGMRFIYDADGQQHSIPITDPVPTGYSTTNPKAEPTSPPTATAQTNLYLYKQFQDGTYGRYSLDQHGNYTYAGSATQQDFQGAQAQQAATQSLNTILNGGALPLTAGQKAQIAGLAAQWQDVINKQNITNANNTGAQGVFQMLHGGAGQVDTVGIIADTITKGAAIIADLDTKMLASIAAMQSGFETDNYNQIKSAYDTYNQNESAKNNAITDMQDKASQAIKDAQLEQDKKAQAAAMVVAQDKQIAATRQDQADNDIRSLLADMEKGNATPEQLAEVKKALEAHDFAGAVQAAGNSTLDPTTPAGQYSAYVKTQTATGKPIMTAGDFLAAQKYKEAYASASANAAAQSAFSSSDKNQAKLEHQLQAAALSSRSDLGIQNKKVSVAIDLKTMLSQFKKADGTYDVPRTNYTELAVGLATLLSPTGIPAQSIIQDLQQKTASGDLNSVITYVTGVQQKGTTQDILETLAESIDRQGQTAEVLRNQQLAAQTPSDLDPARADAVIGKLPSYDRMSNGDISYQSPETINATAVTKVSDFVTDPINGAVNTKTYNTIKTQYPNASPIDIAQILGLIPIAK